MTCDWWCYYGVSAYFTFYRLSYFYRTVVHYSLTSRIYPVTYKQTKRAEKTEKRKKENQWLKRAGEKNWVVYLSHFVENLDVSRHNNDGTPKKRLEFVNVWSFEINRWRPIFPCAFLCRGYEHELGICGMTRAPYRHKTGTCHMPKYRIACANKSTHPPIEVMLFLAVRQIRCSVFFLLLLLLLLLWQLFNLSSMR